MPFRPETDQQRALRERNANLSVVNPVRQGLQGNGDQSEKVLARDAHLTLIALHMADLLSHRQPVARQRVRHRPKAQSGGVLQA